MEGIRDEMQRNFQTVMVTLNNLVKDGPLIGRNGADEETELPDSHKTKNEGQNFLSRVTVPNWCYQFRPTLSPVLPYFIKIFHTTPTPIPIDQQQITRVAAMDEFLREHDDLIKLLKENLEQAQHSMKQYTDLHRTEREFSVGDWVYLRLQPYRQVTLAVRKSMKLSPRFYGPYKVLARVGKVAHKLDLPENSKLHPVFHVALLKKKLGNTIVVQPGLPLVGDEGQLRMEPEANMERRMIKRGNKAIPQ